VPGVAREILVQAAMAWHAASDEKLFRGREVGDAFRGVRGIGPGPGGEFVDEVVACGNEFFGGDLAGGAEGGGVGDGCPAVAEGVEGGVDDVHGHYDYEYGSSEVGSMFIFCSGSVNAGMGHGDKNGRY